MTGGRGGRGASVVVVAVLFVLPTAGCQAFWQALGGSLAETRAVEQFEAVRAAAKEFVAAEPAGVIRPFVRVDEAEGPLLLNRGAPVPLAMLGFESDDPWRVPFAAQVETELLRRAFNEALAEEEFWQGPLAEADTVVIRALRDILEEEDSVELDARLRGREAELAAARTRLEHSVNAFARERGLQLVFDSSLASTRFFRVPVSTQPDGGIVRMLTFLAFKKQEIRGVETRDMPWRSVLQSPADLLGVYEVWVTWPDTGEEARERVHVRSEAPIVLRPTSGPPDG